MVRQGLTGDAFRRLGVKERMVLDQKSKVAW